MTLEMFMNTPMVTKNKECAWCHCSYPADSPYWIDLLTGLPSHSLGNRCRICTIIQDNMIRVTLKSNWESFLASGEISCVLCGISSTTAFEFDHVDPEGRMNPLNVHCGRSPMAGMTSAFLGERQIQEILKCVIVCSNCHAEKTRMQMWSGCRKSPRTGGYMDKDGNRIRLSDVYKGEVLDQWLRDSARMPTSADIRRATNVKNGEREFTEEQYVNEMIDWDIHLSNLNAIYEHSISPRAFITRAHSHWKVPYQDPFNILEWEYSDEPIQHERPMSKKNGRVIGDRTRLHKYDMLKDFGWSDIEERFLVVNRENTEISR